MKNNNLKNSFKNILLKFFLRIFLFFLGIVFLFFLFSFLGNIFKDKNFPAVIFFDVGQGDASLLRNINGKNILIDGGADNLVVKKLGKFLPYFNRELDFLVISHFHDDHVVGLIETCKRYKVKNIILASGFKSGLAQDLLLEGIEKENKKTTKIIYLEKYHQYKVGASDLLNFNPLVFNLPENNNNSLITKLECPLISFLFSGDNEVEVEETLVKNNLELSKNNFNLEADVFKASHHGSKTSNSFEFLKIVSPKIFVISVAKNNRFNHPSLEVLERIENMGIIIKRTDLVGDFLKAIDF